MDELPETSKQAIGTPESWEEARRIAGLVGTTPASFYSCVRYLQRDGEQNASTFSRASSYCLKRLLQSEAFFAPLYYAALTFRSKQLGALPSTTPWTVANLFKADELAAMISLIYLFRRIRRGCDAEMWQEFYLSNSPKIDVGGFFGQAVPAIGFANGVLVPGARLLGQAMFLGIDKKNFERYRRSLKRSLRSHVASVELMTWKCTHAQVASILLQSTGLGASVGSRLFKGLLDHQSLPDEHAGDSIALRVSSLWIDTLLKTGQPPEIVKQVEYFPIEAELSRLLVCVDGVRSAGSKYQWLSRGKKDLTAEKTPALFAPPVASTESTVPESQAEQIPEELVGEVSAAELEELSKTE